MEFLIAGARLLMGKQPLKSYKAIVLGTEIQLIPEVDPRLGEVNADFKSYFKNCFSETKLTEENGDQSLFLAGLF